MMQESPDIETVLEAHISRTGEIRTDLLSLVVLKGAVFEGDPSGKEIDLEKAMDLFWNFHSPRAIRLREEVLNKETLPDLPVNELEVMLETLETLEKATRVPYEPDAVVFYDERLFTYLHVSTCRALQLKKRDSYSEDVRSTLENAWRAACRMGIAPFVPIGVAEIISAWAVTGLGLVELFRVRRLEGKYEEALHLLAQGLMAYGFATEAAGRSVEEVAELIGLDSPESQDQERRLRGMFEGRLSAVAVDPQEAVDVFENLQSRGRCGDWKQVVVDCKGLAGFWSWCLRDDELVTDAQGNEHHWSEFWHLAQGWAEAQLSSSDLREVLNASEDQAAENRLKAYFFEGALWEQMPERAQRALVDGDRAWFSAQAGRVEASLNELQVVTESLGYCIIWERLMELGSGGQHFFEFLSKVEELREKGLSPTLANYAWACRRPFFEAFIAALNLDQDERTFLKRELPTALDQLRNLRDAAQHEPSRKWRKEEVTPIFKRFLGIGCPDVLPRLVKIGWKIAPQAKRDTLPKGR